jgi:hypothetical protein
MAFMAEPVRCDICDALIPPHMHFMVRTDVFFNPDLPEMSKEQMDQIDFNAEWKSIFQQMEQLTPQEAQDQVHRRFEHRICGKCHREFLANPLGKPRGVRVQSPN